MGREAEKAMLISLLTSGELKNTHTHKRTRDIWNIKKTGKHFYTNIFTQTLFKTHNVYGNMNTYSMYHNHIFLDVNLSSDATFREILSVFLIMSLTVIDFFNQKVITVTADSQVTTGGKMSVGTVVA